MTFENWNTDELPDLDDQPSTVTAETDLFSVYSLVYKEEDPEKVQLQFNEGSPIKRFGWQDKSETIQQKFLLDRFVGTGKADHIF